MNVKIHGLLKILIFSLAGVAYAAEGLPQLNHGHFLEKRRHLAKKKQQSPPSKAKHKGQQKKKSVKNVRPEKKTAMAKRRGKGQRIKALKAKSKEMQRLRSGAEEGHQIQLPNSAPVQSKRQKIPTGVLQSSAKNLQINSEFQNPIVSSAENEKPIESKNLQPMIPMKESKSLVAPVAFRMEDLGNENIFEGQSTYEESYKKLREKLGLTKDSLALGERRINAWKDGFKHKNFSSNPLRATIQTFFSYEENYKDLMQRAHEIIGPEAEKIPGFHFWSVAEIQKASGEIDGGGKFPDFQVILGLGVESLQHF
ncbi:MAG: hypothetical protein LBI77_00840, partial [Puniceicoccales bacterium]|nr:hypothetical protein [Puniceicoccales bacterium]